MTIRAAEVAQVSSDCLSQFDLATARGITQQVRSLLCQNLLAQPFPNSNGEFIHGWQSRHECNVRRAADADIELPATAKIGHSGHSFGDTRAMLDARGCRWRGGLQKSCR